MKQQAYGYQEETTTVPTQETWDRAFSLEFNTQKQPPPGAPHFDGISGYWNAQVTVQV